MMNFGEELFLLQGRAPSQQLKQGVFHVLGCILSALVDGFKLREVGEQGFGRDAELGHSIGIALQEGDQIRMPCSGEERL